MQWYSIKRIAALLCFKKIKRESQMEFYWFFFCCKKDIYIGCSNALFSLTLSIVVFVAIWWA